MCGIAGYWSSRSFDTQLAELMASQIKSRGPDDFGVWRDSSAGLALVHRRLSIIDLSAAGHQPMISSCGRYVIVYNGEIYNHMDIRAKLEADCGAVGWRGYSDTETLLAALRHWGVHDTLGLLNGMFAFALWDRAERRLFLARDRMGEKPLYYGFSRSTFLFGSELKALAAHPDWLGELDRGSLALFMRHSYIPAPQSIYKDIFKLKPAHYVVIGENGRAIGKPKCYWNLGLVAAHGVEASAGDSETLTDRLNDLLMDAVGRRMVADVPLGAFLSGGYDSSLVVALMQAQSGRPVKTFSIGFYEKGYNEAMHAKAVAAHLGTDHTELFVTPAEAMDVIPKLSLIYDEPFSDSSQIPTYLVSQLAKDHVTVSLSGDGGDELFYGYGRYLIAERIWNQLSKFPLRLRRLVAAGVSRAPGRVLENAMGLLPNHLQINHLADRLPKLAEVLASANGEALYRELVSHNKEPSRIVLGAIEPDTIFSCSDKLPNLSSLPERMMFLDMETYLPGDILTKLDRASMAVSLEARVPLLDHRVVEFAWQVPQALKYRDGGGKWLLRQVLYRYVPKELVDRPKMGFGVPIEHWLRGPLRDWAEELLDEQRLREEGFLDPTRIRKMWEEHLSGKRRWHYHLWDVLMFQAWYEHWKRP